MTPRVPALLEMAEEEDGVPIDGQLVLAVGERVGNDGRHGAYRKLVEELRTRWA